MQMKLKPLREQTVVLTGATSGIGLVTARTAARSGARLVLAARNHDALERCAAELSGEGAVAATVVADVAQEVDVRRIAETAVNEFGGVDSWINNAGVSVYGRLWEVPIADHRRLFETNFWGLVYGSLVALEVMKKELRDGAPREFGGALINIGSTLSDRAIPVQGMYSASKHAVKGFTDALRMEVEREGWPISVTLIKPAAIDTPYIRHARNYMGAAPSLPPPVYDPQIVADAILRCAEQPRRDLFVGAGGKLLSALGWYAPRLSDRLMERTMFSLQRDENASANGYGDNLYGPGEDLEERGGYGGYVMKTSAYTQAALHPRLAGALALGSGFVLAALLSKNERQGPRRLFSRTGA